jgi:glycosyltransferase involved in cell wall biosynthesis
MKITIFRNSKERKDGDHPLSILIVLRSLDVGGSQRQAIQLAKELRDSYGARVAIWTLEKGGLMEEALTSAGISWENHPILINHQGFRKAPDLFALTRAIRKWRADIILPFNDFPNKACGAIWEFTGARACIWNQRDEGREVTNRFLERRALRRSSIFIANSFQGVNFLNERFSIPTERITVIPNGVRLPSPQHDRAFWRQQWGIAPTALVAVMVAHLHHYKDHDTLLRAWALVQAQIKEREIHLLLAGQPGDTNEALHHLCNVLKISGRVHFLGYMDDIPGVLKAVDVAVFSSQFEGMPNGVLESMAAGLPIAATRIIGISEALGDDYPLLVPPGNAPALANGLLRLIQDESLRFQLGEQNKCRAEEEFSVTRMGRRYIDLLTPWLPYPFEQATISGANEPTREN